MNCFAIAISPGLQHGVPLEEFKEALSASEMAHLKGYEGDPCGDCGQFTMVRNGTCRKCITCGTTTGCS